MSVQLICPACNSPVEIFSMDDGINKRFYTGCWNDKCPVFIETGLYKSRKDVEKIWPWKIKK